MTIRTYHLSDEDARVILVTLQSAEEQHRRLIEGLQRSGLVSESTLSASPCQASALRDLNENRARVWNCARVVLSQVQENGAQLYTEPLNQAYLADKIQHLDADTPAKAAYWKHHGSAVRRGLDGLFGGDQ